MPGTQPRRSASALLRAMKHPGDREHQRTRCSYTGCYPSCRLDLRHQQSAQPCQCCIPMPPVWSALPSPRPLGWQPEHATVFGGSKVPSRHTIASQPPHVKLAHPQVRRLCRGVCFQPPGLAAQDKEWASGAGGSASDALTATAAPESPDQQPQAKKRRQRGRREGDGMRQSTAVKLLERKAPRKAAPGREGEPASAWTCLLACLLTHRPCATARQQ